MRPHLPEIVRALLCGGSLNIAEMVEYLKPDPNMAHLGILGRLQTNVDNHRRGLQSKAGPNLQVLWDYVQDHGVRSIGAVAYQDADITQDLRKESWVRSCFMAAGSATVADLHKTATAAHYMPGIDMEEATRKGYSNLLLDGWRRGRFPNVVGTNHFKNEPGAHAYADLWKAVEARVLFDTLTPVGLSMHSSRTPDKWSAGVTALGGAGGGSGMASGNPIHIAHVTAPIVRGIASGAGGHTRLVLQGVEVLRRSAHLKAILVEIEAAWIIEQYVLRHTPLFAVLRVS